MSDDKNTTDIDHWLDDFDEPESEPAEGLDQSNIDELLGNAAEVLAEEQEMEEVVAAAGMDQSDIDMLLGGGDEEESGPEEAGDAGLDQSDIDMLLGGADEEESGPEEAEDAGLDQSDIDMLLGGADEEESGLEEAGDAGLDQSDIDMLLGGADEKEAETDDGLAGGLDQSDVNMLLGNVEEEPAEEAVVSGSGEDAFALQQDELGIDADEFEFDESLPDIPDEKTAQSRKDDGAGADEPKKATRKIIILPAMNRKVLATVAAACLVAFVGSGLYMLLRGPEKTEPVAQRQPPPLPADSAAVRPPVNIPPKGTGATIRMAKPGREVTVRLSGQDDDGDPLRFQLTGKPAYGKLSGEPPTLTYMPGKDFPGRDRIQFRVSDGKAFSRTATVVISGPALSTWQVRQLSPKRPRLAAKDVEFKTTSRKTVVIDWRKIWRQTNNLPFSKQVAVDVDESKLRGTLTRVSAHEHRYQPHKLFGGTERLPYRFQMAGVRSKKRVVRFDIRLNDLPPEIHLKPLAKSVFLPGETVMLDAGATEDEDRAFLVFRWRQLAGVPVRLNMVNNQASAVSFVVPSSFYTARTPEPRIQLTVIDQSGQKSRREVTISTRSRREAALWGGKSVIGLIR